jgi:copper transport protein
MVAPSAGAHAALVGTDPGNEQTINKLPSNIVLTFSEDVGVAFGGVKLFAPDGKLIDAGSARIDGTKVFVPTDDRGKGTYAVSWRIISADTHPVRGAAVYHYGQPSGDNTSERKAKEATETSQAMQIAYGVARFAMLAGVLLAAGAAIFALVIAPGWRARWLGASLIVAILGCAAAFVLDAAVAGGFTLQDTLTGTVLREQSEGTYGSAVIARAVFALICLSVWYVTLRGQRLMGTKFRWLATIPFIVLAVSLSFSGHAIAADPRWLRLPVDMLHSLAAALWLGGLVQLLAVLKWGKGEGIDIVAATSRYSTMALGALAVLIPTGAVSALNEIGWSRHALLDTTYGQLVFAKVLLLLATMPMAAMNRYRNVPALEKAGLTHEQSQTRRRLSLYVRGEIVLLVVVVALTAWLIASIPAKVAAAPELIDKTVQLKGGGSLQVTIDPGAVGRNEVHVYVLGKSSTPDASVTNIGLEADNRKRDIGPLKADLRTAGPGHATTGKFSLPIAGNWTFVTRIQRGKFDEERVRFTAEIAPQAETD